MSEHELLLSDFDFDLPLDRIAQFPLADRASSRLLHVMPDALKDYHFRDIVDLLRPDDLLVMNNTKVIKARLLGKKETGGAVELLMERITGEFTAIAMARASKSPKAGTRLIFEAEGRTETVTVTGRDGEFFALQFEHPVLEVLDHFGKVPLPPYIEHAADKNDESRYQTVYAQTPGAVAAPTAGLHFAGTELDAIRKKGVDMETVCLHVGAGTFLPVKSDLISGHRMHREPFIVRKELIRKLIDPGKTVVSVGTTSVRTLESLYYAGVDCIEKGAPSDIGQWVPYGREYGYSTEEALTALAGYLDRNGLDELKIGTRIIIVPGFRFRVTDILVTNFHQPQSTLLLLISAFVGGEWRRIYDYALENGFRFLSYGDSSILFRSRA